jgi:hypothetical protein
MVLLAVAALDFAASSVAASRQRGGTITLGLAGGLLNGLALVTRWPSVDRRGAGLAGHSAG